ncbi:MAG TPA: hypothetical protein VD846_02810 [Allosphingosinicella sp.]|nr:hypothetical protein [Allosphingosinicella sp.]
MRNNRTMRAALAVAFAVSAAVAQAQSAAPLKFAPGANPAIWRGSDASGPIVHLPSNVTLPARLEGFTRTEVAAATPEDVIANYSWKEAPTEIAVSVYLFRPAGMAEHRLKGSVAAFAALNPSAFLWSSGPFDIPAATPLHSSKSVFKTGIGPDTVMDYLYFVAMGRWTVKVRASLTGVKEDNAEGRLDAFVRALPWAELLAANGACTGAACTAPASEMFRSHFGEMMLGKLLDQIMKFDPKAEAKLPIVHRVEAFGSEIAVRRAEQGPAVYVATVPRLATYRIVRLPDPVKPLFVEGYGRMSLEKPLYALLIDTGGGMLATRFYNGEPSVETFAEAVDRMVMIGTGAPFLPVKDFADTLAE